MMSGMTKRIVHIDMDAFFAAVEIAHNPDLAGKPLIVGGTRDSKRGVVSTASYEAREFGVHSAMPIAQAVRLCPQGIFMRGNRALYVEASRAVRNVLETFTPLVEFASIDEAYLDVTGSMHRYPGDEALALQMKADIREATNLPCTVAIASNRLVAKIGSDHAKPDGHICIAEGDEAAFLAPMPLAKLPGAGPRTREKLSHLGIETIGDLAEAKADVLLRHFGAWGYDLQRRARGRSSTKVVPHREAKSISRETTFTEDQTDWTHIEQVLFKLAERATHNMREHELETKCVTLKVRYASFDTKTFAMTLPNTTDRDGEIFDALHGLVRKARARSEPVRLVGVALSQLSHDQHQLELFDAEEDARWGKVMGEVDGLRDRFGFEAIQSGHSIRKQTK